MKLVLVIVVTILSGCSSLGSKFSRELSNENVMQIESGMNSEAIVRMLGYPHSVQDTTCGGDSPWNCIIWNYEDEWTGKEATFYFRTEKGKKILNSFDIKK